MKKKTFLISIILISTIFCIAQPQLPFIAYENNPVLSAGNPGTWDDDGVFLPFIFEHDGTYYLLYSGSTDLAIAPSSVGFATSQDGYNFTKSTANPIFGPDGTGFDAWSVSDVVLFYENSTWILYYSGDASSSGFGPGAGIGRATASNLEGPWERLDNPVLETGDPGEWDFHFVAPMSIIKYNSEYIMYYSSSIVWYPTGPFQVGMATSPDGIVWTKYDDPDTQNPPYANSDPVLKVGSAGSWDEIAAWYGSVQKTATGYEMFYSGTNSSGDDAIGYATSTHGISWTKNQDPIYSWLDDPYAVNNNYVLVEGPKVQIIDGLYFMYYDYGIQAGTIGLAVAPAVTQIIHVPGDQPNIQAAIDIATHGDTILVDEGTYYENINFMGKAITVASQFIIDWDESHIENTIIDGSQPVNPDQGAVIHFISGEDTTSIIKGFTITGGTGILNTTYNVMNGGGIAVENSGAKIEDNIITENNLEHFNGAGGCGIGAITLTGETWLVVRNNEIINNSAIAHGISAFGGGIASTMNSIIQDNNIEYNECTNIDGDQADGGGVEIEQIPGSSPIFADISGNAIRYNTLTVDNIATGAGIMIYQASAHIHNNAISNNMVVANQFGNGAGIYVYNNQGDIIIENNEINNNEIVSESWARGGGIAFWEPAYKVELTNNTIQQNHIEGMDNRGAGVWFRYPSGDVSAIGNLFQENTGPINDITSANGGGLCVLDATGEVVINKNRFIENEIHFGGGLYLRNSLNTIVSNNFFKENDAFVGGGIYYYNPTYKSTNDDLLEDLPLIVNNTLIYNTAESHGGGVNYQCPFVFPILFNSIIRYNTANLGNDIYSYSSSEFVVYHCNVPEEGIFGEWTGDYNIDSDPMIIDDFGHISNDSECIEAGTLSLEVNGEVYSSPDHDIDGQARPLNETADIGADEVLTTAIPEDLITENNATFQISPNPCSGATHLRFTINEQGFTICDLYEISGVKVKRLLNEEKLPGTYKMEFDLSDLPNGVYFIRLKTNKGTQSTKLIKL